MRIAGVVSEYQAFVNDVNHALQKVVSTIYYPFEEFQYTVKNRQ